MIGDQRATIAVAVAIGLVAIAAHAPALSAGFVNWDDNRFITANPLFDEGGLAYVEAALTRVQFDAYHPLHLLSYLPDRWLWHRSPAGYHAIGLVLFAIDAILLLALARRRGASLVGAGIAAALFAVHPLTVEPAVWISARKDLLALLFFLLAILVEDRRPADTRRPSIVALVLFAAALLTKTSTVCLPLVLFAWLRWLRGATIATSAVRSLPYAVLSAAASIAVVTVWRAHEMIPPARPDAPIVDVLATLGTHARRIVWPSDLSPIYPEAAPHATIVAIATAATIVAVALAWWLRKLPSAARFATIAFVSALLPVANIVPVVFRFQDRYAFLALAMLIVPLALAIDAVRARRRIPRAAIAGLALAAAAVCAIVTIDLSSAWIDSSRLWARAVSAQPTAYLARLKRGETLREAGQHAAAAAEYQNAIRLDPDRALGYAGLFHAYAVRAEREGKLAAGTAAGWLRRLGPALADERAFAALYAEVPHDRCGPCSNTLLLLGLRRHRRDDATLVRSARAALDAGAPDVALVYLSVVADPNAPGVAELGEAAKARLTAPSAPTE